MSGLQKIDSKTLKEPPKPIPWIVKGLVARGALTLLAGVGGLGKSALALSLAAAVHHGRSNYAGFILDNHCRMVYVDCENGLDEIQRRAHYFDIYEEFYEIDDDLADHEAGLTHILGSGQKPSFVILDSFRALYPNVDEDNSKSVLPVLRSLQRIARATNSGILLLHHTTKYGSIFRGSGEFANRPEFTVTMKRDSHGLGRYLDWEKCRMGVEPNRHHLKISNQNGGMEWEHAVPHPPGQHADFNEW